MTEEASIHEALQFISKLRELCGFVENGSDTIVKIFQDDATRDWFVRVGDKAYHGDSMMDAFRNAFDNNM